MCHGTAVFNLSAPVWLLRPRALATVAPPFLFFSRPGCGLTAYQRCRGRLMTYLEHRR